MSTLKQISELSSGQVQHRSIASEIADNVAMSGGAALASGLQNYTHQQRSIIQRKPGEDEELQVQRMLIGNPSGALQAFRPTQSSNNRSSPGKPRFIQTKLSINTPGDQYEQEADGMADKVMRMKDPFLPSQRSDSFSVQRKCAACEDEEKHIHRKENSASETQGSNELDSYVGSLGSSGHTMPESSRQFFEPRFGQDFSNVRVHADSIAAKSAKSINALAYTTGNNIVFNDGQYSPGTESGRRLMAHELTHVAQQQRKTFSQIQRKKKKPPETTLYIGLNKGAKDEAQVIKGGTKVIKVIGSKTDDEVVVGKDRKKYDLNDPAELKAALKLINVSEDKIENLKELFKNSARGAKDEMYKIVDAFNKAENNEISLYRIVLSGHSVLTIIFGDHTNIDFEDFQTLKKIFPKASLQIKHLMVSACSAGNVENLNVTFKEMFPELSTIWAYSGKCLTSEKGSARAIGRWDRQTSNQGSQNISPDKDAVGWSTKQGLINIKKIDLVIQLKKVTDLETLYQDYFLGINADKDPHSGPLFDYYTDIKNLVGNTEPPLDATDKEKWTERIVVVLKLRYYENIRKEFVRDHHAEFSKGYAKLHMPVPNYRILSRKDALNEIDNFKIEIDKFKTGADGSNDNDVNESVRLLIDFRNLNNDTTQRI